MDDAPASGNKAAAWLIGGSEMLDPQNACFQPISFIANDGVKLEGCFDPSWEPAGVWQHCAYKYRGLANSSTKTEEEKNPEFQPPVSTQTTVIKCGGGEAQTYKSKTKSSLNTHGIRAFQ